MSFSWGVDGYGRKWPCSDKFMGGRFVIFSPLKEEWFYDCMELLERQYKCD